MNTNGTVKVVIPGRGRIPRLGGLGPKMTPTDVTFPTLEAMATARGAAACAVLDADGGSHSVTRMNYKELFAAYSTTAESKPAPEVKAKAEEKKAEEKVEDKKEPEAPVEEAPETPIEEIEGVNKFPDDDPEEAPTEEAEEESAEETAEEETQGEEDKEEAADEPEKAPKHEVQVVNKGNGNNNRNNSGKKKSHK